jgi:acyl-CoA synthetase (AMP-forming)/AMP-acid ligase II
MIYRSSYPPVDIPDISLSELLFRSCDRWAHRPALIDAPTGRTLTFAQLRQAVERVAAGFARNGVQQGDVVAFYAVNSIEFAVAFHAVTSLGAITATVNPAFTSEEVERQLRRDGARFLLTQSELLECAEAATACAPVQAIFVIGGTDRHVSFDSLLSCEGHPPLPTIHPATDVAGIFSSSGTTGLPKGVMITHRNLVAIAQQMEALGEVSDHDVMPAQLPFYHFFGVFVNLTAALAAGTTSVILPRFDLDAFLKLIQDYRVTRAFAVPPVMVMLAKRPEADRYDLSSLQTIVCGAAPLGADVEAAVSQRLGCKVKQIYGMTEIVPTHIAPDDVPWSKQGSVGVVAPNTEVRIVDPSSGLDVAPGDPGEIWSRGPQSMKGYFNNPDATASTKDADGWIHTGDLGSADADGYFYIVDRLKELIKYKAYQVAPAELEALLLTHPAVADVAVVRSPDDDAGEVPKAFVVRSAPVDEKDIIEFVAERVAPYKKVRRVEFIDAIPKSPSGKILRRLLVERELSSISILP